MEIKSTQLANVWLVVLSGGTGSRLFPLTENLSKSMVPFINHYPVTEFILYGLAKELGLLNVIFSAKGFVNYRDLKSYYGGGSGWSAKLGISPPVSFEYQDPNFNDQGSADGVAYNLQKFSITTPIIVIANDQLFSTADLLAFYKFGVESPFPFCVGLTAVDEPSKYGITQFNTETKQITGFVEKPQGHPASNLANASLYIIKPEVFPQLKGDFAKDTIPNLAAAGKVGGYVLRDKWLDVGNLQSFIGSFLSILNTPFSYVENFLNQISVKGDENRVWIRGTGRFSAPLAEMIKNRIDKRDISVSGRVIIGKDCTLGAHLALINCSIGDSATIEDGCIIENSDLMDAVSVGQNSVIKNCIIGRGATVGDNSFLENICLGHGDSSNTGTKI